LNHIIVATSVNLCSSSGAKFKHNNQSESDYNYYNSIDNYIIFTTFIPPNDCMLREKEVTIYDLAKKLNISIATVSRALKDDPVVSKKTKKKIAELAEEMGYRSNNFARNLRNQRTNTIGVIVPRLNSYFMSTVIAGIESIAIMKDII